MIKLASVLSRSAAQEEDTQPALAAIDHVVEMCRAVLPDAAVARAMRELEALRAAVENQWPLSASVKGQMDLGPFAAKNIADWSPELADALMRLDYALRDDGSSPEDLLAELLDAPPSTGSRPGVSSTASELIELEERYGAHNYKPLDVVIERASGAWVYDVEGRRYLDFLAAYSAVNQGHCHPAILRAMMEQAQRVTLTSRAFRNDQLPLLYRDLHELTGFEMALPMNSGVEAVETALKAARKWGETVKGVPAGRGEILVCSNNFHGRTISVVGFSSEAQYKSGFGPFAAGFRTVPFGDAAALEEAITPETVAFLVEPVQGEAGIIVPPAGYLREVAAICRAHNVLLLCDEIQSGLGRTGKLFAFEHDGIRPDVCIVGKALSGGFYPVSAVLASREVLCVFRPGDHGSTFGGNPLACAVARAALKVIVDEDLPGRSAELGAYALERLRGMRHGAIAAVRGKGLWIGIELTTLARPVCERLKERGVLCKETHDTVIRLAPPLMISREDLAWGLDQIDAVLGAI